MNYWHMQLHPNEGQMDLEHIKSILENKYIGLGDWKEGAIQIDQFKNNMAINDIVLIRHPGKKTIALVKVVGESEYIDNPDEIVWFKYRRKVDILSWYVEKYNLPKDLGNAYYAATLQKCDSFKGSINNLGYTIGDYAVHWNRLIEFEKTMDRIIELYSQLCAQAISSKHCNISKNDDFFSRKILFKNLVDAFIDSPNEDAFMSFWKPEYCNSIQRNAVAKNIIKTNGSIDDLKEKIKFIINLTIGDNPNDFIEQVKEKIQNSSYASLEFYYVYHLEEDTFPLINNGMKNGLKILLHGTLYEKYEEYTKFEFLKNKLNTCISQMSDKSENFIDKYYYLLDQLLNLIDKIKEDEEPNIQDVRLIEIFNLIKKIKFQKEKFMIEKNINLLKFQKQIILQGPPGTGKTRLAKMMANFMINASMNTEIDDSMKDRVKLIQFHPSYSYEDFVRGIVAKSNDTHIEYKVENKILALMAKAAYIEYQKEKENAKPFVLIIDEINRANLSTVLGELIYALEYRGEPVESMYSEENDGNMIILPPNLYIIGTMNTADRSIGHIDYAIRRRFAFIDVLPDESVAHEPSKFSEVLKIFDEHLSPEFKDKNLMLGHSYFIADDESTLETKLQYQVVPLLKEYLSDGILLESAREIIQGLEKD
jgi:energy-coupling factor transporter ATP-binding protein EcfA2